MCVCCEVEHGRWASFYLCVCICYLLLSSVLEELGYFLIHFSGAEFGLSSDSGKFLFLGSCSRSGQNLAVSGSLAGGVFLGLVQLKQGAKWPVRRTRHHTTEHHHTPPPLHQRRLVAKANSNDNIEHFFFHVYSSTKLFP